MKERKTIIENLSKEIIDSVGNDNVSSRIEVDSADLYDLRLVPTKLTEGYYRPKEICLSWDKYTGFHMDIDRASWEFDTDAIDFHDTALRTVKAIFSGNAELKVVKLFGLIPMRHELIIS